jgi:protein SHQ1
MITPRFSCSQTDESVIIKMYCPSVRVRHHFSVLSLSNHSVPLEQASEIEIHVEETLFTIHVNPYFLRLNFSNHLLEDDNSSAHYDPASGYLTVQLTKETKGENFSDLDLLAKLLAPRRSTPLRPTIEVIDGESCTKLEECNTKADVNIEKDSLPLTYQELLKGWNLTSVM